MRTRQPNETREIPTTLTEGMTIINKDGTCCAKLVDACCRDKHERPLFYLRHIINEFELPGGTLFSDVTLREAGARLERIHNKKRIRK